LTSAIFDGIAKSAREHRNAAAKVDYRIGTPKANTVMIAMSPFPAFGNEGSVKVRTTDAMEIRTASADGVKAAESATLTRRKEGEPLNHLSHSKISD